MKFLPIKTRALLPPKDSIYSVLDERLPKLRDGDVLFITSKILAIHQGRCVKMEDAVKEELILSEADLYIPRSEVPNHFATLTITNNTLIPAAGIDESNGNGYYVLWPKNLKRLLKEITERLKQKHGIKNLGVIATDTRSSPLRYGVTGMAVGWYGIEPFYDYRGMKDIFGRKIKFTKTNVVDSLSSMAVYLMGESGERTPLLLARGVPHVTFTSKQTYDKLIVPPEKDIYKPLFGKFRKAKLSKNN